MKHVGIILLRPEKGCTREWKRGEDGSAAFFWILNPGKGGSSRGRGAEPRASATQGRVRDHADDCEMLSIPRRVPAA